MSYQWSGEAKSNASLGRWEGNASGTPQVFLVTKGKSVRNMDARREGTSEDLGQAAERWYMDWVYGDFGCGGTGALRVAQGALGVRPKQ